ncbi:MULTISPECIES: type II toxin-antitoxin system RelE/ParE family toxin [unclassified Marinobacter]|uniref:type II toxin-antitoxin system RelE/ParE family toxin n=1 Tax=unclassified Marinobacter TaxID=83889 RepID=UPI000BF4D598|nr:MULTISPECIES: type II toxin-antitoxin system RelE/ParE family toxin [unclassified Marinobacter]PFG10783.1 toxin ParE1/3/4 [Marinobacter sp. LV10MA510-1]PFG52677.1 toxin ParE1/3/4 [Marinobacter sp. LV10R520-4]
MRPFLLTAAARKDIIEIGQFSTERWGKKQRNKYLKQLDGAFKLLARQPEIGGDAGDVKPGYRKFSQGSHIIFFREGVESKIVVIRILHNSMDVERHL